MYDDTQSEFEVEWESAARQAVNHLLREVEWNAEEKCAIIPDKEHGKFPQFVESVDKLRFVLLEVYREYWHAYAPFEGGEAVFDSDFMEDEVIEDELARYKKHIKRLGWKL